MSRARRLLAAVLVAIALPVVPAVAEHEVYYRFTVLGYVKDAQGKPIADATVEVTRDKTAFIYLGQTKAIRKALGSVSKGAVANLDAVTGPYDFIAVVEGPTLDAIGRLVTDEIGAINGVTRTTTCVAISLT